MLETVSLDRALCLPAIDIAALLQGQLIAIIPNAPVQRGWTFSLCPYVESESVLSIQQQYHQHILPLAQASIAQHQSDTIAIEAWGKCVDYKMLYEAEQLEALSRLTIWTKDFLKNALQQRQNLLLAFLQVYRIPEPIKLPTTKIPPERFGKFVGLPILDKELQKPIKVTQLLPVLSNLDFAQRKQQLEKLEPPLHPELEDLHSAIAQLSATFPAAKALEADLNAFLGWTSDRTQKSSDLDLLWISSIAKIGKSSDGYEFEKLVRKSLIKLGFSNSRNDPKASLDPESTGGAGGLDVYCDKPYSLVGECKASQYESVSNGVSAQLINIGTDRLGKSTFEQAIKVIFAAGKLTSTAKNVAIQNEMNVMLPETLQKLVELKAKHPGSINLLDLKSYLQSEPFGEESDQKLKAYISKVQQKIKVRSHVVEVVKQHLQNANAIDATADALHAAYAWSKPAVPLDSKPFRYILFELASPLAGYLGHRKDKDNSDRFYYLRDLKLDF
jgi:hypothetical protein